MKLIQGLQPVELELTVECYELAHEYIKKRVIPLRYEDDAFHIAVASVNNLDAIISWNFKHIVNFNRIRIFNAVNVMQGYKTLDIRSPLEVCYENEK